MGIIGMQFGQATRFDPKKVKKLSNEEIIERLKAEEREMEENLITGVFVNFDDVEGEKAAHE